MIPLIGSKFKKWGTFAFGVIQYYMKRLLKWNLKLKDEEQAQMCLVVTNYPVRKAFCLKVIEIFCGSSVKKILISGSMRLPLD